jgi:hypothetical protein
MKSIKEKKTSAHVSNSNQKTKSNKTVGYNANDTKQKPPDRGELLLYADMANGLLKLERHAPWKGKGTVVFALSKLHGEQLSRLLIQS